MADEGLHDIQLNGKELVFLFMAGTVVAVVIFLCGVMVGRGVRAPRTGEPTQAATASTVDPTAPAPSPAISSPPSTTTGTPTATHETLSYTDRLEAPEPANEKLRESSPPAESPSGASAPPGAPPAASKPAPATAAAAPAPVAASARNAAPAAKPSAEGTPAPAAAAAPAPAAAANTDGAEPSGPGFVVQVAATRERGEADTIARRLTGKGYPAFVTTPANGPRIFRVRVGKYTERRDAESVAGRLEKEEQFKPWITR